MTHPVQDRVKIDWEKAQKEGGQRAIRIREIVKAAAIEALAELKDGSSEIETLGRKSLAEMIEQLKAKEAAEAAEAKAAETINVEEFIYADEAETASAAPTWAQIFAEVGHLANDRKVEWAQRLLSTVQIQVDRFDTDMATEYGDRYGFVRPLVHGFRSLVALAYSKLGQSAQPAQPAAPIHIEVLDDVDASVDDTTTI